MNLLHVLLPLTTIAASLLPAQAASVAPFGTGCPFLGQTLTIGATGLPQLGTTVTITYSGPNQIQQLGVQPMLGLGLTAQAIPLPASLLPTQPANCFLWIDAISLLTMPSTGAGTYQSQVPIAIPNQSSLIGFPFVAQWAAFVVQCGFLPPCVLTALPTSDALSLTVGL